MGPLVLLGEGRTFQKASPVAARGRCRAQGPKQRTLSPCSGGHPWGGGRVGGPAG